MHQQSIILYYGTKYVKKNPSSHYGGMCEDIQMDGLKDWANIPIILFPDTASSFKGKSYKKGNMLLTFKKF